MSSATRLPQALGPRGPKVFQLAILLFALIGIANASVFDR
jgi:hypothetical protein